MLLTRKLFKQTRTASSISTITLAAVTAIIYQCLSLTGVSAQCTADAPAAGATAPGMSAPGTIGPTSHTTVTHTTSKVMVYGWEQSVIKDDKNLGHWYWNPMSANVNNYNRNNNSVYAKPAAGSHYVKPTQVPFTALQHPTPKPATQQAQPEVSANLSDKQTSASLLNRKLAEAQAERNTSAKLFRRNMAASNSARSTMIAQIPPAPTAPVVASRPAVKIASYGGDFSSSGYSSRRESATATGRLLR